jgi:leucyl aminopeptidase
MHYMKSDMGGATAVLGTLIYAAEMKLPVNIVAVLPITDNAISEKACFPVMLLPPTTEKPLKFLIPMRKAE